MGITVLIFNGYWLGIARLTGAESGTVTLMFILLSFLIYPQLILFSLIFSKLRKQNELVIFISFCLLSVVEWYVPGLDTIQTGQSWIEYAPHLRLAPILGLPIYILFNYYYAWSLFKYGLRKYNMIVAAIFIALNLNFQSSQIKGPTLRLVQTSHAPFSFLSKEFGKEEALKKISESVENGIDFVSQKADVIIFPETTWPFPLNRTERMESQIQAVFPFISDLIESGVVVGMGAPTTGVHDKYERYYNSFLLMEKNKVDQIYSKYNLMPLAESPLTFLGEDLTASLMKRRDFTVAGTNFSPLVLPSGERFQVDICFDGDAPYKLRDKILTSGSADFLLNIANDYWFNPSSQAYGHLWRSRWNSVLFSLPMARVANDGITAFVGWDGVIDQKLPAWDSGFIEGKLRFSSDENNIFLEWGLLPFFLFSFITSLGISVYVYRNKN